MSRVTWTSVAALLLLASTAHAQPCPDDGQARADILETPLHFHTPFTATSARGVRYHLPPAFVVSELSWETIDAEMKTLQTARTRLTAENRELRDAPAVQPGIAGYLVLAGIALGTGFAVGVLYK